MKNRTKTKGERLGKLELMVDKLATDTGTLKEASINQNNRICGLEKSNKCIVDKVNLHSFKLSVQDTDIEKITQELLIAQVKCGYRGHRKKRRLLSFAACFIEDNVVLILITIVLMILAILAVTQ